MSELGTRLIEMGAGLVALKVGHRGLYLRTAGAAALETMHFGNSEVIRLWASRELWAPCFATTVVGTTGSGDATIAGFLLGLLHGKTPEATLTAACAVGACSVEVTDALSGIRSWNETAARIDAGWARRPLHLEGPGWHLGTTQVLWFGPNDRQ